MAVFSKLKMRFLIPRSSKSLANVILVRVWCPNFKYYHVFKSGSSLKENQRPFFLKFLWSQSVEYQKMQNQKKIKADNNFRGLDHLQAIRGRFLRNRTNFESSFDLMNAVSKDVESKMFSGCLIILEVWTTWRPPEAA